MLTYTGKKNIVLQVGKFTRSTLAAMTLSILLGGVSLAKEAPTYAMVQINQQALFFNQMNKGAADEAKKTGAKLVVYNANNNPVSQNDAIENYIQQGVKGIMVDAIDVNGILPAIAEAAAKNIPVIAIDAVLPASGKQKAQVGVDNIKGGEILGNYFTTYVTAHMGNKAKVGIVGALNSAIQNDRQKGFENTLKGHSGITVVGVVDGQNIQDNALTAAENLITGNPSMTAIYATGEPALLGAIAAVENQGRQKDIKVFGWDLTSKAISGIDQGYVTAVLQQDPLNMGVEAVKALNKVVAGQSVAKTINVPATVVTASNVNAFRAQFK